eukprot:3086376-Alexandrium_andersonii.AAC.1
MAATAGNDQVCLHLVTSLGPRVFKPPAPGVYAAFWDNGLPHGSRIVQSGDRHGAIGVCLMWSAN